MARTHFRPGHQAAAVDAATGLHLPVNSTTNIASLLRDAGEAWPNDNFEQITLGDGDVILSRGNTGGAGWIEISKDPMKPDTETVIRMKSRVRMPFRYNGYVSLTHRNAGQQTAALELLSDDAAAGLDPLPAPEPIEILNASQTTTTITVNFASAPAVPLRVGQVVSIYGFTDTRLNVNSATVASVVSPTQITVVGNDYTLTSTTIASTPGNGAAFIERVDLLGLARNGVAVIHGNATAANRRVYTRAQGGLARPSGTLAGAHAVSAISDAANAAATSYGADAWLPGCETRIDVQPDVVAMFDRGPDTSSNYSARHRVSQAVPNPARDYFAQFRVRTVPSLTRPVAKIVSVSKSGSTTATVTTDGPHGLTTGEYVGGYGVRDQTNFANLTTGAVCTVTGPNTFTVVWGASATVTSYGGFVMRVHGQQPLGGAIAQVGQSVSRTGNVVTLVGNATWAAPAAIGNLVELIGIRDAATGADLGLDGTYNVVSIATTSLVLEPVPGKAPTGGDIGSVNCGGGVVQRFGMRIHAVMLTEIDQMVVESAHKGSGEGIDAIPVIGFGGSLQTSGSVAIDSAFPNPLGQGLRAANANPTAMSANADLVGALATMIGAAVVKPYAIPEAEWTYSNVLTTTSDVVAQTAGGAGIRRHLTWIGATNTGGSAVDLIVKDGSNTRLQITIPAGQFVEFALPTGILSTANTALNVALSAAGTVRVNLLGYTAP